MSTKHTPGPWWVEPSTSLNPSRAVVLADCVEIYDAPLTSETAANACLIAAAPDLLAACKALFEVTQSLQAYVPHPEGSFANQVSAALIDARAAIARAEGKE